MYIKKFEKYNEIKLDTRYELRIVDKNAHVDDYGDELEFSIVGDDLNFNPFSLEEIVKLYMKHEKDGYRPGELIIKQVTEKTVSRKTIDDIILKINSKKYNL